MTNKKPVAKPVKATKPATKDTPLPAIDEGVPRFRILLQDGLTGTQIAAGTDSMDRFTRTDLMKFVRHFKKQIKLQEDKQRAEWAKYDAKHNKKAKKS
jgi:hypothetical protein